MLPAWADTIIHQRHTCSKTELQGAEHLVALDIANICTEICRPALNPADEDVN